MAAGMHDSKNNNLLLRNYKKYCIRKAVNQRPVNVLIHLRELKGISSDSFLTLFYTQQEIRAQAQPTILVEAIAAGEISLRLRAERKLKFHIMP